MRQFLKKLHPHLTRDGIAGFVTYFDQLDHQFLTRVLMAIDRKFIGALQFARDWAGFEALIDHTILPHVARIVYDYLGTTLYINRLPAEFSTPGKPAILMGINHEAIIEPILLVSLLDRADIRFLGMKVFQYLGPRVAARILPVLPGKIAMDYQGSSRASISNKLDPVYQLYRMENLSAVEVKILNQQSIDMATQHVASGGILMLYPCGGHSIEKEWYSGLGRILKGLPADILTSTPIFPVMTTGLTRKSVYRSIHNAAFRHKQPHSVQQNILDTIFIPSYLVHGEAREIVSFIQDETMRRVARITEQPSLVQMRRFPLDRTLAFPSTRTVASTRGRLA